MAPEKVAKLVTIAVPLGMSRFFITSPEQQRRSWYMFLFQMVFAETAVAHNHCAFLERLWREWSPGWEYPPEEMAALKATFQKPGVLPAALNYYRHTLNPANHCPELACIRERMADPVSVPTLYIHGAKVGCIGLETIEGMEKAFMIMVQEFILDDGMDRPPFPALFSLNMLLGTPHGQSYSQGQLTAMLAAAGVGEIRRIPLELPNGAGVMAGVVGGK